MAARKTLALTRRVARLIAAERERRDLSQETVAERIGTAPRNYQRIESGTQNLTLGTIERVAKALGTSGTALLFGAPKQPSLTGPLARLESAGYAVRSAAGATSRPARGIEVTTLSAAAGRVARAGRLQELLGWVVLGRGSSTPRGQFVAEITGHSMSPRVPNGSLCLFGPARSLPYGDRIFLVSVGAQVDDDTSSSFLLKRIASVTQLDGERRRVELGSINPTVRPLIIETHADDDLRVVAELLDVLVRGA